MSRLLSQDTKLFLFAGGVPRVDRVWKFFSQNGPVEVEGQNDALLKLLPLCDGTKTLQEIMSCLEGEIPSVELKSLIQYLFDKYVLVDRSRIYEGFINHLYMGGVFERQVTREEVMRVTAEVSLPPVKGPQFSLERIPSSAFGAIAATRRTTYYFGDKSLSFTLLCSLFWSMYGIQGSYDERLSKTTYTLPSGGGLYGQRVDIFLFKEIGSMKRGHYLWRPKDCGFEYISSDYMDEIEDKMFNPKIDLNDADGAFVISADLNRVSRKYANSAFPLSYLEAGHAMQNGYLFCSQENIGFAEIFGFRRRMIEEIINTPKYSYYSLTCGLFGCRPI